MLLAEPSPSQLDLHFSLLGIPVRITPWFWLTAAILGWNVAQELSGPQGIGISMGAALLIWTAAVLISITVHEFGHALTFRAFGVASHVVLYQFGGLAVPEVTFGSYGRGQGENPWKQILISMAGPGAQLLLAIAVAAAFHFSGYYVPNPMPFKFLPWFQNSFLWAMKRPSPAMFTFEVSIIIASVSWALLNLLPVYPLDGGRIAREVLTLISPREGIRFSLVLSILAAAAIALWAFQHQDPYLGIMFAMLGYGSFMTLQAYMGRGGYGGGFP